MPRKIRQLKQLLLQAAWYQARGGKGSHSKWKHAKVARTVTLSGNDGQDARPSQEKDVLNAVAEALEAESEGNDE